MAKNINYKSLLKELVGLEVDRPNKSTSGTLSGHAAGEPFEKAVYHKLKSKYPKNVFKQYEFLNDLYLKNPKVITKEDRASLFSSPTAHFLLSRSDSATRVWSPTNVFEEKQSDTADIVFHSADKYELIDVKTRNVDKNSQPPNIISSYKLAQTCARMIDNEEYDTISINYVEVDWRLVGDKLRCVDSHFASLFKSNPSELYINWAAGLQIQFHVSEIEQTWNGDTRTWTKCYLKHFVDSAKARCKKMEEEYIIPFLKYID